MPTIAQLQNELYDSLHFGSFPKNIFAKFAKYIFQKPNPSILDVGCGEGHINALLRRINKPYTYLGLDASPAQIALAKKKGIHIRQCDISSGFNVKSNAYDVVLATEIIEHVYDTTFFLQEAQRVLKPGGVLILTTPNVASLGNRIRLLFGRRPGCLDYRKEGAPGHIRAFVKKELDELIKECYFQIIKSTGKEVNLPFFNVKTKLIGLNNWLADVFPTLSSGFVIVAKKKSGKIL